MKRPFEIWCRVDDDYKTVQINSAATLANFGLPDTKENRMRLIKIITRAFAGAQVDLQETEAKQPGSN